ncbi:RNA polymerase sigma factor [Streptomyces tagetis]|uniref:Sigma-70 family RNA polymerase sigma factor n=1 Tax=Streptomyces tagetis TaxID=2820809 RepID=A0A941B164_9ACTN|nr:sigma-70 family RNA polymerase sigma factor [Streptomyces sp. RG38]MBQ0827651.1 sigma-70 family RNA polymerase sigma factor [Streptomyces sp. RG38]
MSSQANAMITPPGSVVTDVVTRAAGGDREAFASLYNEHRGEVFLFLVRRTGDRLLAEDLASETFVRALHRIETFSADRSSGRIGAWLCVIAQNLVADHFKAPQRQREVLVDDLPVPAEQSWSAEAAAMRQLDIEMAAETVTAAMATLTAYQRDCLRMRFLEGLSVSETAARLGKGAGAVRTLQFRAVATMRAVLAAEAVAA